MCPLLPPGEKQTDPPTYLKVANRSELEAEGSPARAGAERSEREKGGNYALGIPKGAALGAPLVTFSATGKSPGVEGRSALPVDAGAGRLSQIRDGIS